MAPKKDSNKEGGKSKGSGANVNGGPERKPSHTAEHAKAEAEIHNAKPAKPHEADAEGEKLDDGEGEKNGDDDDDDDGVDDGEEGGGGEGEEEDADEEMEDAPSEEHDSASPKKRKTPPTKTEEEEPDTKAPRRSARQAAQAEDGTDDKEEKSNSSKSKPGKDSSDTAKLLTYLLSSEILDLLRPNDETKALSADETPKDGLRTYTASTLNPFEELVAAIILSRPISHVLGHRSIRTVLNPPYEFSSAKAVRDAGKDKCVEAMYEAHTQHKEKTAAEIFGAADSLLDGFAGKGDEDGSQLAGVREKAGEEYDEERKILTEGIKGVGKTGMDIFFRRVQWLWPEVYPFVDERTAQGLEGLGLPSDGDELVKVIDEKWSQVGNKSELDGKDDEEKKRRAFVIVLERAILAQLEKKGEAVKEASAAS